MIDCIFKHFSGTFNICQITISIFYNCNQLIALSKPTLRPRERPQIPDELKRRRRRYRAGAKHRMKYKPFLPLILMGNVRSLVNKMDELGVLTRTQREYRELCVSLRHGCRNIFHTPIPPSLAFRLYGLTGTAGRVVRRRKEALFIKNKWCNPGHVTVKERFCSPDIPGREFLPILSAEGVHMHHCCCCLHSTIS